VSTLPKFALVGAGVIGKHHGKVSDLAYHNSLMVQVWSMLDRNEILDGLSITALMWYFARERRAR